MVQNILPISTVNTMLGLNPHMPHPFQSMLPGLHQAAAAAAAMQQQQQQQRGAMPPPMPSATSSSGSLPPPPPIPPHTLPSMHHPHGHHSQFPPQHAPRSPVTSAAASSMQQHQQQHHQQQTSPQQQQQHPLHNVPLNMWPFFWNHISNLLPQLSIAKMDPLSQVFCLRWNNHRNNLLTVFDHLLQTEAFCDVTLACDGSSIKCHKMILSACSAYFQQLFMENQCEHPIVFLKDIKYEEIRAILDYMYKGEVNVAQEQLPGLLKVAELLRVKGLVEEEREKLSGRKDSGRPVVSNSQDEMDRPRSSSSSASKVNGGSTGELGKEPSGISRSYLYTPPAGAPQFPMWPLPGIFQGAHNLFNKAATKEESDRQSKDGSTPSPKETSSTPSAGLAGAAKRKKTASGSGGSTSSKENGMSSLPAQDQPQQQQQLQQQTHPSDLSRNNLPEKSQITDSGDELSNQGPKEPNAEMSPNMEKSSGGSSGNIANYVPNQRLEWKRYKQYTRNDIMSAIEEVKKGMSALQASRKYGVPSRTLYDKVKKMGITTGRQMQRKSLPQYPASFPHLGGMVNLDPYKDISDRYKDLDDSTNDSSTGDMDNRATLVPPNRSFPTLQMLNLMERMKESERNNSSGNNKEQSEITVTPINLTTMLARDFSNSRGGGDGGGGGGDRDTGAESPHFSSGSRDHGRSRKRAGGRMSDSSMSPNADDDMDDEEPIEEEEIEDDENHREEAESTTRERHISSDIRAQVMADLRRTGGNIPTQSGTSFEDQQPATSTTNESPPPSTSHSYLPSRSQASEDNLPPRKRKVSQERHQLSSPPANDRVIEDTPLNLKGDVRSSPVPPKFNGEPEVHEAEGKKATNCTSSTPGKSLSPSSSS